MEPILGEIRIFAGNYAPVGWYPCDGRLLTIAQNQALYSLLGIAYGGDGKTTFALPDLRGRVPIHVSNTYRRGTKSGDAATTLTAAQLPAHTHTVTGATLKCSTTAGNKNDPTDNYPALNVGTDCSYAATSGAADFAAADAVVATASSVGGQPINNMMPSLAITYMIAYQGIYPPRS